jgi:hypothetical protein
MWKGCRFYRRLKTKKRLSKAMVAASAKMLKIITFCAKE